MKDIRRFTLPLIGLLIACGGDSSAPPHTTAVSVAPSSLTIDEGSTGSLTAAVTLSNGQSASAPVVAWLSANPAIATVAGTSVSATVTAVTVGQTSITATSGGVAGNATIIVRQSPAARVSVSLASATIVLQATSLATASVFDAGGRPLTGRQVQWSSTNPTIATVSSTGLVRGISKGTSFVRATVEGRSDSARVTVLGVASVVVSPDTASMPPRGSLTATATVTADPGIVSTLSWSSSVPAFASVSAAGLITALGPAGAVVIRAQSVADPTKYDSVRVTVFDPCTRPAQYTMGSTVSGTIALTDCGGNRDDFVATVTAPTFFRLTLSASFPVLLFHYRDIPQGLAQLGVPVLMHAYAFVPAGTIRIQLVSQDTAVGRTYSVSSTIDPPDGCHSTIMGRGLSRAFPRPTTCQTRQFSLPPPTAASGPLVVRANAAGYAVSMELKAGATLLTSATAPGAGQDAVITYSNTQNTAQVLQLFVTGPSTIFGPFTLTINP